MRLLLDTNVWLWMTSEPERIGPSAMRLMADESNDIVLSVASVWEIVIKHGRGKLKLPVAPAHYVRTRIEKSLASVLPIELDHVLVLQSLEQRHKDPFDRVLIAQAISESCTLMTADSQVLGYPVHAVDARI